MVEILAVLAVLGVSRAAWPRWVVRRRSRARRQLIDGALADVAEVLLVVLGAGATVSQSIEWLATRGPEVAKPAFAAVIERTESGRPLVWSMAELVDDLSPAYWPMVTALTAAVRDGSPVSSLLLRLGDEARTARRRSNDRRARSLPVQMLFPLVCCSLPAVLIGAVVPLVLVALGRL